MVFTPTPPISKRLKLCWVSAIVPSGGESDFLFQYGGFLSTPLRCRAETRVTRMRSSAAFYEDTQRPPTFLQYRSVSPALLALFSPHGPPSWMLACPTDK